MASEGDFIEMEGPGVHAVLSFTGGEWIRLPAGLTAAEIEAVIEAEPG